MYEPSIFCKKWKIIFLSSNEKCKYYSVWIFELCTNELRPKIQQKNAKNIVVYLAVVLY